MRELRPFVQELTDRENRIFSIKMPANSTKAIRILGSDAKLEIDLSNNGVTVTGCLNGAPGSGVALYLSPPKQITT